MYERLFRYAAGVSAAIIIVGTLIRGSRLGQHLRTLGPVHVLTHCGAFALLGALVTLGFRPHRFRTVVLLLALLLGFASESYEHLVFGSPMEYMDIVVDSAGVLFGALAAHVALGRRQTAQVR